MSLYKLLKLILRRTEDTLKDPEPLTDALTQRPVN